MPVNMGEVARAFGEPSGDSAPKRGDEIFAGDSDIAPVREWSDFIGQAKAKEELIVRVASAKARGVRLPHALLASGIQGVGKTTLAKLVAYTAEVGLIVTTGPMTVNDFREQLLSCQDHDMIFVDEAHRLVERSRTGADWLLPWMLEGKLVTKNGAENVPDVTLLAATTDAGKLPETLLSRFMIQPELTHYNDAEATQIAQQIAWRMDVSIDRPYAEAVAVAADHNPRMMQRIFGAVRDLNYAWPESHPNLAKAFDFAQVSADGLSLLARDVLLVLATTREVTASLELLQSKLGEPGPLKHAEKQLLQRGLMDIRAGKGRVLTEAGARRAHLEAQRRMGKDT